MTNDFAERIADHLSGVLCRVIGHRWVEVPVSFRGRQATMRFKCARCPLMGGFTN